MQGPSCHSAERAAQLLRGRRGVTGAQGPCRARVAEPPTGEGPPRQPTLDPRPLPVRPPRLASHLVVAEGEGRAGPTEQWFWNRARIFNTRGLFLQASGNF